MVTSRKSRMCLGCACAVAALVTAAADLPAEEKKVAFPGIDRIKKRYAELFPEAEIKRAADARSGKRALSPEEMESLKQSVKDLREIIRRYPRETAWCAKTQNQIGETCRDMGEYEAAIEEYEKVSEEYPNQKDACAAAQAGIQECQKRMREKTNAPAGRAAAQEAGAVKPAPPPAAAPADAAGREMPAGGQYVFTLKNGKEMRGEIIKETKDSMTIRFSGNTIVFDKSEIEAYRKAE